MKKIFNLILCVSVFLLVSGTVFADTPIIKKPVPVAPKYTLEQQTCINNARKVQQTAVKSAQDSFKNATVDALKTRQDAIKTATDTFNTATVGTLKKRQTAIKSAQSLEDPKAKMAAMKKANEAYNNNESVKSAKVIYMAAVKIANDAYNNDLTVQQAKPVYETALKNARAMNIIKDCTTVAKQPKKSFWQNVGGFFNKSTSALVKAITFVK